MAQLNSLHVFIITSCILAHTAVTTYAYPQYRDEIPNGLRSVEVDEKVVEALGHENKHGGGALNIFGKAFKEAGFEWTNALCMADTDGDGESNGLELGDPCCIWRVGLTSRSE